MPENDINNSPASATSDGSITAADIEKDAETGLENIETSIENADGKPSAAMMLSASELLAMIRKDAKSLLQMIEAIPDGVAHGWHSLGAEIRSRI
jgi:septation ring formation regulator EzrA